MIHLWSLNNENGLDLNITELMKYPILSTVYNNDTSPAKYLSKEYFKYLDFLTNSNGYCIRHGLAYEEAHKYAIRQTKLPKDYVLPKNHKDIYNFVKNELEYDVINVLVNTAVKALRVSAKSLQGYIDALNELGKDEFKDSEGNTVDVSNTINKVMKTLADIPGSIERYETLINKQKDNTVILRGPKEYTSSMDGDDEIESYISNKG